LDDYMKANQSRQSSMHYSHQMPNLLNDGTRSCQWTSPVSHISWTFSIYSLLTGRCYSHRVKHISM
jgi:hypothetical protein